MINFNQLIDQIIVRKGAFLLTFFIVFTFSYGLLFAIDFLPEAPSATSDSEKSVISASSSNSINLESGTIENNTLESVNSILAPETVNELPLILKIPSLNREVTILNPISRSINDLDNALLSGVVRHPDSAVLGQEGNLFILGHSSYLPKVFNKNFQALNGIQNLKWGDIITLESTDTVYTYQVKKVYQAKAANITVPIAGAGKHLTLATCNSFGSKDDRYIVEADLLSTTTIWAN